MSAVLHWLASQCSLLREYADFYTAFAARKPFYAFRQRDEWRQKPCQTVCALIDNRFWLAKGWLGAKMVLAWMVDELNARRLRDW